MSREPPGIGTLERLTGVNRDERARLYDRLELAERRVAELEGVIEWYRDESRREAARSREALARAREAESALEGRHSGKPAPAPADPVARAVGPVPASALWQEAADADVRVAQARTRAHAERSGTQTGGPFVPAIPLPAGPVARPGLLVAGILDQFSKLAFSYEFDYMDLSLPGWEQQMEARLPDVLLVESAWRGSDDQWQHRISRSSRAHDDLIAVVEWCRRRDVPTVFWNKEDPPNFDFFKVSAALFDHVFTTDADCIPRYLEILDHDRVDVLPFAAQPRIHNPIYVPEARQRSVAFAGTYYARKHPNRKVQMEAVVDPARDFGVEIFSRVANHPNFAFPEKYEPHVVGTLTYSDILTAYKLYRVFLNVNSVIGSSTMCARRVFELLAAGTSVVSGVSPAIVAQLGEGLVVESADPDVTRAALRELLDDEGGRARTAVRGLRRVLSGHTYGDRTETILRAIGSPLAGVTQPTVSAVALVADQNDVSRLLESLDHQSLTPSEIVLVPGPGGDEIRCDKARVLDPDRGETVGGAYRRLFAATTGDYVSVFDPAALYGRDYLVDAVNAFRYADVHFVGRRPGIEQEYVEVGWLEPASLTFRREALELGQPRDGGEGTLMRFQLDCSYAGGRLFATDRFNFSPPDAARTEGDGHTLAAVTA